ncbi:RNA polymerase II elongation factor ELL2 [Megalops cyprinoides]|uniref:RNA polymerase II elongation factor ELL2 n=1 Tax=Megalops cyprinoides TaxID=118141 RepID=UPI0018650123|nr:RNA polymerase II elongation factor ELL2 [Megalops cyprinoides]
MAALCEEGRYRLSCGRNGSTTTVMHVKLTETVYRALKNYQNCKNAVSSRPTIQFKGQQGSIKIPRTDDPFDAASFDFFVSSVGKDGPQGSFECIRQYVSSHGVPHLACLGTVQDKITVSPSGCQAPRDSAAQQATAPHERAPMGADADGRRRDAKVSKPDGPNGGKKVPFRKPAPSSLPSDLVPERKRSTPINPATILRKGPPSAPVSQSRYRDRVIHLLALRPCKKLAVLARLQRENINPKDLGSTLQQVANLNPKDNSYSLKDHLYREVKKDWPGYSEEERLQLEQVLASKFGLQCESPPTSSPKEPVPASQQRRCQDSDFIDPLMPKKPRISHINNRAPTTPTPSDSHAHSQEGKRPAPVHLPVSNPPLPLSSRSPSTPEGCGTQALPVDGFGYNQSSCVDQLRSSPPFPASRPAPAAPAPADATREPGSVSKKPKKRSKKRRESEERHPPPKAKVAKPDREESKEGPVGSTEESSTVIPDYVHKYTAVVSMAQRQSYKEDFNAEYSEYCGLHARVESITRRFAQLDAQCKRLQPGTKEHREVQAEVLQEYNKLKHVSPSYREMKHRYEYLHNKLAHIKSLITDFDQWRTRSWDYSSDRRKDSRAISST